MKRMKRSLAFLFAFLMLFTSLAEPIHAMATYEPETKVEEPAQKAEGKKENKTLDGEPLKKMTIQSFNTALSGDEPDLSVEAPKDEIITNESMNAALGVDPSEVKLSEAKGYKIETSKIEWMSTEDARLHHVNDFGSMKFRLSFALSGQENYPIGSIRLVIPKQIFKNRAGNKVGYMEFAIPESPATNGEFAYAETDDSYVITNTREFIAATSGYIEGQIKGISEYQTKDFSTGYKSDMLSMNVMVTTPEGDELELKSNEIWSDIDTYARVTSATKRGDDIKTYKPGNWPDDLVPENPEQWVYATWHVNSNVSNNQPYTMTLEDQTTTFRKPGGESQALTGARIMGIRSNASSEMTKGDGSNKVSVPGASANYYTVYTVYPKSNFEPGQVYYLKNDVKYTLTAEDDKEVTTASDSAELKLSPITTDLPNGHFIVEKDGGHVYSYALNKLRRENAADVDVSYSVYTKAYGMLWTKDYDKIQEELDKLSPEDREKRKDEFDKVYGHIPYKTVTRDYAEFINHEKEQLKPNEYYMKSVGFSKPFLQDYVKFGDGGYNYFEKDDGTGKAVIAYGPIKSGEWGYQSNSDDKNQPDLRVFGKSADGDWVDYGTVSYKSGSCVITPQNGAISDGSRLTFPKDKVHEYKVEAETKMAAMTYSMYPVITIKATERLRNIAEELFKNSDLPVMPTVNMADMHVIVGKEKTDMYVNRSSASNELTGFAYGADLHKTSRWENDKINRRINLFYNMEATIQTNLTNRKDLQETIDEGIFKEETGGTWYDLLPLGVKPIKSSIRLRGGDKIESVDIIENYKDSGRTLLKVKAKLKPNYSHVTAGRSLIGYEGYADHPSISFRAVYSWDDLKDIGSTLVNRAVYESDNEKLGTVKTYKGEPDAPIGNHRASLEAVGDDKDLLTDLNSENNNESYLYAKSSDTMDILMSAITSVSKQVDVNNEAFYNDGLDNNFARNVYEGGNYTYKIRVQNPRENSSKDIVLYDNIENYVPVKGKNDYGDVQWRGEFKGVNTVRLEKRGIKPIVYYSTKTGLVLDDTNNRKDNNLKDMSIWSTMPPSDLSKVTAIAIDASKTKDGKDFVLEKDESISATIEMKAPIVKEMKDVADVDRDKYYDTELEKIGEKNSLPVYKSEAGLYGGAHAYNNVVMISKTISKEGGISDDELVRHDYTKVGLKPFKIDVQKSWDDGNDRDGLRPENVVMELYADGKPTGEKVTLTADGKWKGTFGHQLYAKDGKRITYTVKEVGNDAYKNQIIVDENDEGMNFSVTNVHEPEKINIKGTKTWSDLERDHKFPEFVTVNLYVDGVKIKSQRVRPDSKGEWKYSFDDLYKYDFDQNGKGGRVIEYKITEEPIEDYIITGKGEYGEELNNRYYPYGDLWLKKEVKDGTPEADKKTFTFTLDFTKEDGSKDFGEYDAYIGSKYEKDPGLLAGLRKIKVTSGSEVELKKDEVLTVKDLPSRTKYKITEKKIDGFRLDGSSKGLEGEIRSYKSSEALAVNKYDTKGKIIITGEKELENRKIKNYQFLFDIYEIKKDGSEVKVKTGSNDGEGKINFGAFNYNLKDANKTFKYVIRERDDGMAGYVYDKTEKTFEITTKDNGDGTLTVTSNKKPEELTFKNVYKAEGDLELKAYKQVRGRYNGEITPGPISARVEMIDGKKVLIFYPENGKLGVSGGKDNWSTGDIYWNGIKPVTWRFYDLHPYVWHEWPDEAKDVEEVRTEGALIFDGHFFSVFWDLKKIKTMDFSNANLINSEGIFNELPRYCSKIYVKSSDEASKLNKEYSYTRMFQVKSESSPPATLLNLFKPLKAEAAEISSQAFDFEVKDKKTGEIVAKGKNNEHGEIAFTPIHYTEQDIGKTFTYEAYEVKGDDKTIIYDDSKIEYTVTVFDNGNGTLSFDAKAKDLKTDDAGNNEDEPVFVNKKKDGKLRITKRVVGENPDPSKEFKFKIKFTGDEKQIPTGEFNLKRSKAKAAKVAVFKNGDDVERVMLSTVEGKHELVVLGDGDLRYENNKVVVKSGDKLGYTVGKDGGVTFDKNFVEKDGVFEFEFVPGKILVRVETIDGRKVLTLYPENGKVGESKNMEMYWGNSNEFGWKGNRLTKEDAFKSYLPINIDKIQSEGELRFIGDMKYMFYNSQATSLDVSSFNTSNVTNMNSMFYNSQAKSLDLSSFDTKNVWDMSSMFRNSQAINLNLSSFDISSLINVRAMFFNSQVKILDLSSFDMSNITDLFNMFRGCKATTGYARTQADADKFNDELQVYYAKFHFIVKPKTSATFFNFFRPIKVQAAGNEHGAVKYSGTQGGVTWEIFEDGHLLFRPTNGVSGTFDDMKEGSWSSSKSTYLDSSRPWANYDNKSDKKVKSISFSPGVKGGASLEYMFNCSQATSIDLSKFDTSNVTNMNYMFFNSQATSLDLSSFDTNNVTSMIAMFNCSQATSLNLLSFNTSKVTNMDRMFSESQAMSLNLSNFDTSNVVSMVSMFFESQATSLDLSNFDTSNVTNMNGMFFRSQVINLDLSSFDTHNVTSMKSMFDSSKIEYLNLSNFDTRNVTDMGMMFAAQNFNKIIFSPNFLFKFGSYYYDNPMLYSNKYYIREDKIYGPWAGDELMRNYKGGEMAGTYIKISEYQVAFDGNGAGGSMASITLEKNVKANLPSNNFTRFGYTFKGFSLNKDGSGTLYQPGQEVMNLSTPGKNITLYAIWKEKDKTVNIQNGEGEFTLQDGETIEIGQLPHGIGYEIYEETPEGWVLVQSEGERGKIESLQTKEATFVNEYNPKATQAVIQGKKFLDKNPMQSFEFELLENGRVIDKATSNLDGSFSFNPIVYKAMGEKTYTIREVGEKPFITYDKHQEQVTVKVTGDGDGKLSAQVVYDEDGAVFKNTSRTPKLSIKKVVEGGDSGDQVFTVDLMADKRVLKTYELKNNETINVDEALLKSVPEGSTFKVVERDISKGYELKEISANEFTLDKVDSVTVTNTKLKQPTYWQPKVSKVLENRELKDSEFIFELYGPDGNKIEDAMNTVGGEVVFNPVKLDKVGDYVYKIKEIVGDDKNITYDEAVREITLHVKEDGDKLTFTEDWKGDKTFTNVFKPTEEKPKDAIGGFTVKKTIDGLTDGNKNVEFDFTVRFEKDGKEIEGYYGYSSNKRSDGLIQSGDKIKLKHDETVTFEKLPEGTKVVVTEDKVNNYSPEKGSLSTTIEKDQVKSLEFVNRYEPVGSWIPKVRKELTGPAGIDEYNFEFILLKDGKLLDTATNRGTNDVFFKDQSYTIEDIGKTYVYTIAERNTRTPDIVFDKNEYDLTVKVKDDGHGKIYGEVIKVEKVKGRFDTEEIPIVDGGQVVFKNDYVGHMPTTGTNDALMAVTFISIGFAVMVIVGRKKELI